MGHRTYLGGSTIIGPRSGWFCTGSPIEPPLAKKKKRKLAAKTPPARPNGTGLVPAQRHVRTVCPESQLPARIAKRLNVRMKTVEVMVRKKGGEVLIVTPQKSKADQRTRRDRPLLGIVGSGKR